jgi:hypothetical protein
MIAAWVLKRPRLFRLLGSVARWFGRRVPLHWQRRLGGAWSLERELPLLPVRGFFEQRKWAKNIQEKGAGE